MGGLVVLGRVFMEQAEEEELRCETWHCMRKTEDEKTETKKRECFRRGVLRREAVAVWLKGVCETNRFVDLTTSR